MSTSATKVSDTEIEVTVQPDTPEPTSQKYDVNFLEAQKIKITADMENYIVARQRELDFVNDLLRQATELGVVKKPDVSLEK